MMQDESTNRLNTISRRSIVRTGTKLAYAAPIVAVSMKMERASANGVSPACTRLRARLSGANEVPPNASPGVGKFAMSLGSGTIFYELECSGLVAMVHAAHVHRAPAGVNGPVVIPLAVDSGGNGSGNVAVDQALIDEIAANPAGFYVNVHSATYPGGEVRGQLSC